MLVEGFYKLLGLIDYLVYKIASSMINVNIDIATKEIFDANKIGEIANRIYIVVGVLMLFKLVLSAVLYLINPDTFDDKEKGLVGILRKTAVSITLIVLAPAAFNFMIAIQNTVVEAIPKIIFGTDKGDRNAAEKEADNMSFIVLSSFVKVNNSNDIGDKGEIVDLESFRDKIAEGCGGGVVGNAANCKYNYMIIISTIAGGFMCYVLLSMTMDVAIRTIKFGIIRILAPIPISSYMFSKDKLNKFIKTTLTVYCDLFIRLAIIYFIIFAVKQVIDSKILDVSGDDWFKGAIVNIAIIGGLFAFAKSAPKFITDLLGLQDVSGGDMADMFKPAWQRNGTLSAMTGIGKAAAGNAINSAKFMKWSGSSPGQKLKNAAKVAGSSIAGAASAGFHGGIAAAQGKNAKEVNAAGYKRAIRARQNRDLDKMNHVTAVDRAVTAASTALGIDTKASLAENKQKAYSTLHSDVGSFKKAVMGRIDKNPSIAMRGETKYNSAVHQLGQMLMENKDIIDKGTNEDLKKILGKFTSVTDNQGRTVYTVKPNQHIGYYDLEAVRVNAEQEHIGSISGKIEPLKTIAQKEIFSDAMAGKVEDISGNLIDEINFGNEGYIARGIDPKNRKAAHSDVTTAVQSAMQHISENGVPLGINPTILQKWFQGSVTQEDINKLAPGLSPTLQAKILNNDFGSLDDYYQRASEELSSKMASSKEHLARASIERRDANKDKK